MAEPTERDALAALTEAAGWRRWVDERVDVYIRDRMRIRVIWRGDDAISAGSRFMDDIMVTYSNDSATVRGWLTR